MYTIKHSPKKGRIINSDGYVFIRMNGRYFAEHRLIMERRLKRKLSPREHVHHKDGNRQNNKLSNLEVLTINDHLRHHAIGRFRHPINGGNVLRWCPGCESNVPVEQFWKDKTRCTGVQTYCNNCRNAKRREYRHRRGISKNWSSKYASH